MCVYTGGLGQKSIGLWEYEAVGEKEQRLRAQRDGLHSRVRTSDCSHR